MKPPGIKTRKKLVLFTVAHSLSGAIFGLNLSLFNMIRASVLEGLSVNNYIKNPIMVNLFFSIGGILACLLAGPLIRHYPRRLLNLSLAIASILFTLLQLIPWTSVINIFRLLIGFVSIFYTFLSPVCFKEYLPQGVSAQFSSFFYVGVCLGICFSFGVGHSVDNVAIAKFLITFPVYLELVRLFILLRWFHCESPRFVSIQLFKSNPKKIAFLQKSFNSQFSKKNTALEFPNDTFNLREGDEDILQEDLIEDSIQSVNIDFYISDREPILDNPKHSLKLFIQSNEQIQNYLHTFYSEEDGKIAFNFFFNEFIKVFHRELLPLKVFSWSILRLLIHRNYRLQIFVLVLLNFLNQMTGVNCLIFYSVNLFTGVGLSSELVILNLLVGKRESCSKRRCLQPTRRIDGAVPDQPGRQTRAHLFGARHADAGALVAAVVHYPLSAVLGIVFGVFIHDGLRHFAGRDSVRLPSGNYSARTDSAGFACAVAALVCDKLL